jgi:hypothetical protein
MAILPAALIYTGHTALIIPHFWVLFCYISALTFMVVATVLIVQRINSQIYAQAFLAATVMKILALLFFALFFIRKFPVNHGAFLFSFFYPYFLTIVFEIYSLLSNLRDQNQK